MRTSYLAAVLGCGLLNACSGAGPTPTGARESTAAAPTDATAATAVPEASAEPSAPAARTMLDLQKEVVRAKEAAWAAHSPDALVAAYAPNAQVSLVTWAGWSELPLAELKTEMAALMAAFPDAKLKVTRLISTSERAAIEWTLTGTHQGELMGAKPTGKPFGIRGASFFVINRDGKVERESEYFDLPTIQGQVGIGPRGKKVRPVEAAPTGTLEVLAAAPGEEQKSVAVLKRFYERTQLRDHPGIAGLFADDAVISNSYEDADMTKAQLVKYLPVSDRAFINPGSVVQQCVSAGEYAACEYEWTSTWKGPAMGKAPTGKTGKVHELDVARVKEGKIVRADGYGNGYEFDVAFGVVKPTPPPPPAKPEATPPAKPEATPPAKPEATPPAKPEATPPAKPEATPPAKPEATPPGKPAPAPPAK